MATRRTKVVALTGAQKRALRIQQWAIFLDTKIAKEITEKQIREMNAAFAEFTKQSRPGS